jgi:16S rRNA (adenine1518-N6/adenine1519-N6)-dimethyltransferase
VLVGLQATLTRVLDVPAGAFRPVPQVRSTVVRLTFGTRRVSVSDPALFERLVKALFSQRRKTLTNALKRFDPTGPAVVALAGLDGQRRPETLTIQDLARLSDLVAAVRRPAVL